MDGCPAQAASCFCRSSAAAITFFTPTCDRSKPSAFMASAMARRERPLVAQSPHAADPATCSAVSGDQRTVVAQPPAERHGAAEVAASWFRWSDFTSPDPLAGSLALGLGYSRQDGEHQLRDCRCR